MASLQGARPLGPTNARDRTSEFMAVVQRLQSSQGPSSSNRQDLTASPTPASHSAFSRHAAAIGLGIHSTSQKLAQLAALARRTSMFDDPAQEIGELSSLVKADIQSLSAGIAELAAMSAGPSAGPSRQAADHSHTVVDSLRSRLKDATKEFKDVLTLRTDSLRVHADRRSLFSAEAEPRFGPPLGAQASFLPTQSRHPLVQRVRGECVGGGAGMGWVTSSKDASKRDPGPGSGSTLFVDNDRCLLPYPHHDPRRGMPGWKTGITPRATPPPSHRRPRPSCWRWRRRTPTSTRGRGRCARWRAPSPSWAASSSSWRTWWRSRGRWRCASTRTWTTRWPTWMRARRSCSSTTTPSPPIAGSS
ncbi:SYP3 [Auxenochlorella protothecoides x Auxenochlorella symbiontica]